MEEKYTTRSTEETKALAQKLVEALQPGTMLCLSGELGSGKTTFAQGFLESLGAEGPFISPTFVIMKEYTLLVPARGIKRLYHVDTYRIEEKDLENIGFAEWCADSEGVVILEWPERAKNLLPKNAWHLTFQWKSDTEREIVIQK